ncbi:hypothetical protein DMC63_06685 [Streptomyces sp. WAC 05977]|nr:hypothetical protein DMC63_06685 [Streptomyces sp. WAC 05977]
MAFADQPRPNEHAGPCLPQVFDAFGQHPGAGGLVLEVVPRPDRDQRASTDGGRRGRETQGGCSVR